MPDQIPESTPAPDPVEELVFLYLEEREQGVVSNYEEFAKRHTNASAAVRERIAALERAGLMGDKAREGFPEKLGSFRLIERLGDGGMGVVFLAEEANLGRRVALKLIRPEQIYFPGAKERFRREVEAIAKLSHPGIVQVFSFAEENGVPFFAMEHVQGASLGDVLRQFTGREPTSLSARDLASAITTQCNVECSPGPMFEGNWVHACLEIARQIALALEHAHERGVVHRDIKPSNVMITPDGRARLLDFGLATRSGAERLTRTGAQLGSLPYMPPELVSGHTEAAGARTDVYSLGATLHEALALSLPFQGESAAAMAQCIESGQHESLRRYNPQVSIDIETICNVAMDVDPRRRYASAASMAADLACVEARRPIAARRTAWPVRMQRWMQRNPASAAALTLGAIVLVGGPLGYATLQTRAAAKEHGLNDELRRANTQLTAAKSEVETKNAELSAALVRESTERDHAQHNFNLLTEAVDDMLANVGADDLKEIPHFGPVREKILGRALDFYERMAEAAPGRPHVAREQARSARSMGDLQASLGRPEAAEKQYETAVARAREALALDPDDEDSRYTLGSALGQLAGSYANSDRQADALAAFDELLPVMQKLADERPSKPVYAQSLSTALLGRGLIAYRGGELEAALDLFTRAIIVAEPLYEQYPEDSILVSALTKALSYSAQCESRLSHHVEALDNQREAWRILKAFMARDIKPRKLRVDFLEVTVNFGLTLMTSDPAEAERVLRAGYDEGLRLIADFPEDPAAVRVAAGVTVNLGILMLSQDQGQDTTAVLLSAITQAERLRALAPLLSDGPYLLATALGAYAAVLTNEGNLDAALANIRRAIELTNAMLETLPTNPAVRSTAASCLMQRGEIEAARGDWKAGLESAKTGLEFAGGRNDITFQAFETLLHISREAGKDARLSEVERAAARAQLVSDALDQLELAIHDGFSDLERLKHWPDYEELRPDPRFQSALEKLGQAAH